MTGRSGDPARLYGFLALLFVAGLVVYLLPLSSHAQTARGTITSELYGYEDSARTHVRPYLRLNGGLTSWVGSRGQALEFHANLRWTTDLSAKFASDPQTSVYDAYLHLSGLPRRSDLYLGRQFVYNAIGGGLIDGARLRYRLTSIAQIDLFGGSTVAQWKPERVQSLGGWAYAGARSVIRPAKGWEFGLNWVYRKREDHTDLHRGGFNIDRTLARWRLSARAIYNLSWNRLGEATARVNYSDSRGVWYLALEGSWREPSVSDASLFSLLDFRRYQIARLDVRRTIWHNLAVTSNVLSRFQNGEDIIGARIGLAINSCTLGWHYQSGQGNNSGLFGSASVHLAQRWDGYMSLNLDRYRVQVEADRIDAYSSHAGLVWRPVNGLSASLEGQFLRNAAATSQSRLYLRVTRDFSSNPLARSKG